MSIERGSFQILCKYSSLDELFSVYRDMPSNNPCQSYKLFSSLFPPLSFKDLDENDLLRFFNVDYEK